MNRWIPSTMLAVLAAVAFPGCVGPGHWIEGTWVFDEEKTRSVNNEIQAGDSGPVWARVKRLVGGAVEEFLTGSMSKVTFEFTRDEIRMLRGDQGTVVKYSILERPDGETVVIKKADGQIETYHRDGEGMWFQPSPDMNVKVYFKRLP